MGQKHGLDRAARGVVSATPGPLKPPSDPESRHEAAARIKAEVEQDFNHLMTAVNDPREAYHDEVRELWGGEIPPAFLK
jgi:hypothetical protein